jgi:hypothetical protein
MGLGEKMLGDASAASSTASWVTGMSVPATAAAVPASMIVAPPTKPKTSFDSRCVSARFWPGSVRSSPVRRCSVRPHTPPWLLT